MSSASIDPERLQFYLQTRGAVAAPMAGAVYWGALALLGTILPDRTWALAAFYASGLIFPLGLLLGKLSKSDVLAKSPLSGAAGHAMGGVALTWAITIPAFFSALELVPLCLAIGMAVHWPVIGWMYGRPGLYWAHAIVRAIAVVAIWALLPQERTTVLPAAVSALYVLTSIAIILDVRRLAAVRMNSALA
jgi:hypothetical protein